MKHVLRLEMPCLLLALVTSSCQVESRSLVSGHRPVQEPQDKAAAAVKVRPPFIKPTVIGRATFNASAAVVVEVAMDRNLETSEISYGVAIFVGTTRSTMAPPADPPDSAKLFEFTKAEWDDTTKPLRKSSYYTLPAGTEKLWTVVRVYLSADKMKFRDYEGAWMVAEFELAKQ